MTDRDEAAEERDRAAAERDRDATARDEHQTRMDRRALTRSVAAANRDQAAADRAEAAAARDRAQAEADDIAARRRLAAALREEAARIEAPALDADGDAGPETGSGPASPPAAAVDDETSAGDRWLDEADAVERAISRARSATDRLLGDVDRDQGAVDRAAYGADADERVAHRGNAMGDRKHAAADRLEAAIDRAVAGRVRDVAEAALRRAQHDELTGALARELGTVAIELEINRARRGNGLFVLAFVDVNGLKQVNDLNGHAAGDALLRTVATTIQAHLRPYDPVVRIGGDEFVCGLGDSEPDAAHRRFSQIQAAMRQADPPVSISVGFAALRPGDTLEALTERADTALYAAKGDSRSGL